MARRFKRKPMTVSLMNETLETRQMLTGGLSDPISGMFGPNSGSGQGQSQGQSGPGQGPGSQMMLSDSYDPSRQLVVFLDQPTMSSGTQSILNQSQSKIVFGSVESRNLIVTVGRGFDRGAVMEQLKRRPDVRMVTPQLVIDRIPNGGEAETFAAPVGLPSATPNDPLVSQQYSLDNVVGNDMNVTAAWRNHTLGASDTIIAVIGEGVDVSHPDLYLKIWVNQGEIPLKFIDLAFGDDFNNDGDIDADDLILDTNKDGLIDFYDLNSLDENNHVVMDSLGNPRNSYFCVDQNGTGYIDAEDIFGSPSILRNLPPLTDDPTVTIPPEFRKFTWLDGNNADGNSNHLFNNIFDPNDDQLDPNFPLVDDLFGWNWAAFVPGPLAGPPFIDDTPPFPLGTYFKQEPVQPVDYYTNGQTHAAGLMAAITNNNEGIAGINQRARIMSLKVFDPRQPNGGQTTVQAVNEALLYAYEHGARIISSSIGGFARRDLLTNIANALDALTPTIDFVGQPSANNVGALFVTASGDWQIPLPFVPDIDDSLGQTFYPAAVASFPSDPNDPTDLTKRTPIRNILAIGASNFAGRPWVGPSGLIGSTIGQLSIEAFAPGENVTGPVSTLFATGDPYAALSGTRTAAANAAGVMSLLVATQPDLTPEQMIQRVLISARPLPGLTGTSLTGAILDADNLLNDNLGASVINIDDPVQLVPGSIRLSYKGPQLFNVAIERSFDGVNWEAISSTGLPHSDYENGFPVARSTYVNSGVQPNTTYFYRIRTPTLVSNVVSIKTTSDPVPAPFRFFDLDRDSAVLQSFTAIWNVPDWKRPPNLDNDGLPVKGVIRQTGIPSDLFDPPLNPEVSADVRKMVLPRINTTYPNSGIELVSKVRIDSNYNERDGYVRVGIGLNTVAPGNAGAGVGYNIVFRELPDGTKRMQFLHERNSWGNSFNYNWETGRWYWVSLRREAGRLLAKVWRDGDVEPTTYPFMQPIGPTVPGWGNRTGGLPSLNGGSTSNGYSRSTTRNNLNRGGTTASFDEVTVRTGLPPLGPTGGVPLPGSYGTSGFQFGLPGDLGMPPGGFAMALDTSREFDPDMPVSPGMGDWDELGNWVPWTPPEAGSESGDDNAVGAPAQGEPVGSGSGDVVVISDPGNGSSGSDQPTTPPDSNSLIPPGGLLVDPPSNGSGSSGDATFGLDARGGSSNSSTPTSNPGDSGVEVKASVNQSTSNSKLAKKNKSLLKAGGSKLAKSNLRKTGTGLRAGFRTR